MAFPTTVTTNLNSYHGIGGPYVSSSNAVYILGRYSGNLLQVQVFKATDPTSAFAGVGVNPTLDNGIRAVGACQVGDNIHVVTRDANDATSNRIRYHRFNMATDTWDVKNELIRGAYTLASPVDKSFVGIAVRSGGDKLVTYEGPQVLADIQRSRTYYARNLGSAWSADIALDNGGNNDWQPSEIILGSGNRVHFFFSNVNLADQYQRCLNSANALEAFPASYDANTIVDAEDANQRPVAFSGTAGGTVVCIPYFKDFTPTWNDARFTSADAPTPLTLRTIGTGTITPSAATLRRTFSFANDGSTIYSVFYGQNGNLYIASATETGAWSTPAQLQGSASAGEVFSTVFTRNGSRKVGVCYTRNLTDVMYTEYTLSVAPSLITDTPDHFNFVPTTGTIAFDNAQVTATSTARTSIGLLLTATAGACVIAFTFGGGFSMSSVAINGTQFTQKGFVAWGLANDRFSQLWVLTAAPASGTLTLSAVAVGGANMVMGLAAVTYTGHKTTGDPFGGVLTASAASTATATLTLSSNTGNKAVFGYLFDFSPGVASAGVGLTQRVATDSGTWPDFLIADAPGNTAVTGIAAASQATHWGSFGINLIQSGGDTARIIISSRVSATEAIDTFSASGYVIPVIKIGRLSATDAQDKLSVTGYVVVSARLSATDAIDKFSASGNVINTVAVSGRLSATDALHDTFSATGQVVVRGRLSATDAVDLFSGSASTLTPIHGSIAWTERRDIFSAPRANPSLGAPLGSSNAGGGAGRSNSENVPIPVDLWAAREAYLQSLYPEGPAPVVEADNTTEWEAYERRQQQIVNLTAERAHAIVELRNASDLQSMKQQGAKITELTVKIATLTGKQQFTRFMH